MDCFEITCPDCGGVYLEGFEELHDPYGSWIFESRCIHCQSLLDIYSYWTEYECIGAIVYGHITRARASASLIDDPFPPMEGGVQ